MDDLQKKELLRKLDSEIGLEKFFTDIGLQQVSRSGRKIYSTCPFHNGDNPNAFCWNIDQGFAYCFTQCNKSYSIFDIVMKMLDYEFIDAVTYLSDLVGMDVNWSGSKKIDSADNRSFLSQVQRTKQLITSKELKPFDISILQTFEPYMHKKLREEGFDHDVREYFNLGFCMDGYYTNRITIPIDTLSGDVITVSGRSVLDDEELAFTGQKKYLLYPNTDKSKTLYNISRADAYIALLGEVFTFEGFKSCWKCHQWGIDNTVAVMGSSVTDDQVMLLLKMGVDIIVCGDRDEAGQKLNQMVADKCKKFANIYIMDMSLLDVPEKSSPSDITKEQFEYLYKCRKEVI